MRIALGVEYDGSRYHGWQTQQDLHTVQQTLETAIKQVADSEIKIISAGRTDTGVHATNQVVHFDSEKTRNMHAWVHGVNAFLPKDICVKWAKEMPKHFHARYSATARRYCYVIYNASVRPALLRGQLAWQYRTLNHEHMHAAGQALLGENDFTSFRSIECQSATAMRYIHHLRIMRRGDLIVMDIMANAFLHHMVRNIAGVLMAVGNGKKPIAWVEEVLLAKDRKMGAETASPYGLYLTAVSYPKEFGIVQKYHWPLFLGNLMR